MLSRLESSDLGDVQRFHSCDDTHLQYLQRGVQLDLIPLLLILRIPNNDQFLHPLHSVRPSPTMFDELTRSDFLLENDGVEEHRLGLIAKSRNER